MKLFKEIRNYNGKEYKHLVVQFDNGFTFPVKPCYELSNAQYIAFMLNVEKLPLFEVSVKDINDVLEEGDK